MNNNVQFVFRKYNCSSPKTWSSTEGYYLVRYGDQNNPSVAIIWKESIERKLIIPGIKEEEISGYHYMGRSEAWKK